MIDHVYPGAVYVPVRGEGNDPHLDVVMGVIWHLSATEATSLRRYFDGPSGGIESHLHIPRDEHHPTEQYRACNREADANYRGNSWVEGGKRKGFLSIEFQGADPNTGRYTDHQIAEGLAFCDWAQKEYGFERRVAPGYRSQGIGYHVMWGSGQNTASWSNARGKTCPGGPRIQQFFDIVVPTFLAGQANDHVVDLNKVISKPVPVKPVLVAPPWPLPPGYYFGPKSGPRQSVSGYYSYRSALREWQQRMDIRGWRIKPDGLYGDETKRVAALFGRQCRLRQDGLIDARLWAAAWTRPVT